MADVIRGRPRTPEGTIFRAPPGKRCDEHPDRLAVARLQGATDAFGAKLIDGCAECRDSWADGTSELLQETAPAWTAPEETLEQLEDRNAIAELAGDDEHDPDDVAVRLPDFLNEEDEAE